MNKNEQNEAALEILNRLNFSLDSYIGEFLVESTLVSLAECIKGYFNEMYQIGVIKERIDLSKVACMINPQNLTQIEFTPYTKSLLNEIEIYFDVK